MKKKLCISLSLILITVVILLCNSIAWGATPYKLYLGDKEIKFDADPYEVNNRLLVPIRTISEATGAKVGWDGKTNTVTVYRKEDKLNLTIGSSVVSYNDITIPLDVAPILKNGRTFLPLRFVSEWLGLQVNYEGGTVKMFFLPPLQHPDTMTAAKGNANSNLNNSWPAITWQNKLYRREPHTDNLMAKDLDSGEETVLAKSVSPRYFNLWQDQLYFNLNGNFVRIDNEGKTQQTIIEKVDYCQIHDGWLYFTRMSDKQFCRRLLAGGNIQPLGIYGNKEFDMMLEFVVTDQHIYVNDGYSLLRMKLDGSDRRLLLYAAKQLDFGGWYLNGLEYANGLLYLSIGGNSNLSRICQLNLDGSGLKKIVQDGALEINAIGDWLYYTKLDVLYTSDWDGREHYGGCDIARVKLDGSMREVLTKSPGQTKRFLSPTVMPDGSIYYCENQLTNDVVWHKIAKPQTLSHIN
ncbi:MAG: DUF5050 domain-containing protein [Clostridiales bacterium]|jgi:hypothetical protein|nr:DUF5050 domain-containing protein [Clostridiales bacterium]